MIKFALALLAVAALTMVAVSKTPTNPQVRQGHSIDDSLHPGAKVGSILHRACYDCHSYTTDWPWYSRMPGVGAKLQDDVTQARMTMNFSEWTQGPGRSPVVASAMLYAICGAVQSGRMPKSGYLMLHPEAKLSEADKTAVCAWTEQKSKELAAAPRNADVDELPKSCKNCDSSQAGRTAPISKN